MPPSLFSMVLYVLAASGFLLLKGVAPGFVGSCVVKAIPALAVACAVLLARGLARRERQALLLGALGCAVGDVVLDLDRERLFVPGLAAFLMGHLGFLAFLWMRRVPRSRAWPWLLPVLLVSGVMLALLLPRLGSLLLPVLIYLAVISAMAGLAMLADVRVAAAVGAFVFLLSDALLALAKFVLDGWPSPLATIPVYFLGLFLLGFGVLGPRPSQVRRGSVQ